MKLLHQTLCLLLALDSATSYNILVAMVFAVPSHRNALDPVAEALAARGHQVTLMSPIKESRAIPGVKQVYLPKVAEVIDGSTISFFNPAPNNIAFQKEIYTLVRDVCNATYRAEEVLVPLFRAPEAANLDVIVVDGMLNEFILPLGPHLGIPMVIIAPASKFLTTSWGWNIPAPPSYVPTGIDFIAGPMSFSQRLTTLFTHVTFAYFLRGYMFPECNELIREVLPNSPSLAELERQVAFTIANSHTSVHPSIPAMPYFLEAGCLHCKQAKALPEELEDYMQRSGDAGVIYFSLGSYQKGSGMPEEMRQKIVQVFAQLPQKVLWKYEDDIDDLPKNVRLLKWAPQQDILAHNKTRLFISHGGGLSTFEAAFHSCPILGFPLSADQLGNMANAVHKGFAEALDWRTFTTEEFRDKIQLMLTDDKYKETVQRISALLRDRPMQPLETVVYWIEYIIRHKGATHMRSGADNLNIFQYFLLDVLGFLILVACLAMVALYFFFKMSYRLILNLTKFTVRIKMQ